MEEALAKALALLPHGPEFRFVDRLTSLVPGKEATGDYRVRGDEVFLKGHFPGEPIFPGVLLVEAAAQLAGIVLQTDPVIPSFPNLKLTAMQRVKITGTARPGDTLKIRAKVTGRLSHLVQASASVEVGGVNILSCELTLSGETPPV